MFVGNSSQTEERESKGPAPQLLCFVREAPTHFCYLAHWPGLSHISLLRSCTGREMNGLEWSRPIQGYSLGLGIALCLQERRGLVAGGQGRVAAMWNLSVYNHKHHAVIMGGALPLPLCPFSCPHLHPWFAHCLLSNRSQVSVTGLRLDKCLLHLSNLMISLIYFTFHFSLHIKFQKLPRGLLISSLSTLYNARSECK